MSADPLLRGLVMVGIDAAGTVVAKLYPDSGEAQKASEAAAATGKYTAVILATPCQIRRKPNALP